MGSSICTNKQKNIIIVPVPTKNNEDFSDDDEFISENTIEESSIVLDLFIKCTNLVADNRFQLMNTMACIYILQDNEYVKRIETETQSSTLTPLFNKSIKFNYSLSKVLNIKIEIWEIGSKKDNKVLLGSNIYDLHEIATRSDVINKELEVQGKRNGNLLVWAKELKHYSDTISMQWEFESKIFSKGYFLLRLTRPGRQKQIIIYQSESKKPPVFWESFEIASNRMCQGNEDRIIKAEVINIESEMITIAAAYFSLKQLKTEKITEIPTSLNQVINGVLKLNKFNFESKMSFLDIIRSGVKIHPFYAIDFSEKINHFEESEDNPYLTCIKNLQGILQFYSQDPLYPVLGTGCYFPDVSTPSYCFALNGNIFRPEIASHDILIDYYKSTLMSISPSNSTNFSELLDIIIKYVNYEQNDLQKYYVLFIITASEPTDLAELHNKYQMINNLPISLFILKVDHYFPQFESPENLFPDQKRQFFNIFSTNEINNTLEDLQSHIFNYTVFKEIEVSKKLDNFRQRSNSLIKNFSEKIRSRSNFFNKIKVDYIKYLTNIGYSSEKIDEVSLIGVPFLVHSDNSTIRLPERARTKVMGLRGKSMKPVDLICNNCNKGVFILAESKCGCKTFCYECVGKSDCPNC